MADHSRIQKLDEAFVILSSWNLPLSQLRPSESERFPKACSVGIWPDLVFMVQFSHFHILSKKGLVTIKPRRIHV